MTPTIVKTREAHDFLALVPQLAGFQPERSVVLVAFRGNRTCGALRFNLPEPDLARTILRRLATSIVGTLCKIEGVDAVVPVLYTDERFTDVPGVPGERFAEILGRRAELSGFLVRDSLCVAADGWGSYLDPACPAGGRPLSQIEQSPVNRDLPQDAQRELGRLVSRADLPQVDVALRERCARRLARYECLGSQVPDAPDLPELVAMVGDILDPVATTEAALELDPSELTAEEAATLLFLLKSPARRDQVMLQIAFGEEIGRVTHELNQRYAAIQRETGRSMDDIVAEEQARSGSRRDLAQTGDLMLGSVSRRPDPERIERGIELLKTLVATAPKRARPAPLCMLAWLSWALGRSSVAGIFIDQALAIDPGYGMARLLLTVVSAGHLPEWAFAVPHSDAD
jgi:hypothetical protein